MHFSTLNSEIFASKNYLYYTTIEKLSHEIRADIDLAFRFKVHSRGAQQIRLSIARSLQIRYTTIIEKEWNENQMTLTKDTQGVTQCLEILF